MRRQSNVPLVAGLSAGAYLAAAVGVWAFYKFAQPTAGVEGLGAWGGPRVKRAKSRRIKRAGAVDRRTRRVVAKPMNGLEGVGWLEGLGDLGWGGSFGKAVSGAVNRAASTVASPVKKVASVVASVAKPVVTVAKPVVTVAKPVVTAGGRTLSVAPVAQGIRGAVALPTPGGIRGAAALVSKPITTPVKAAVAVSMPAYNMVTKPFVAAVKPVVSSVAKPVTHTLTSAVPYVYKGAETLATSPLKITREAIRPIKPLNKRVGGTLDRPLTAADKATMQASLVTTGGSPKPSTSGGTTTTTAVTQTQYQDASGNPITEAQYNDLMAHANDPVYQDANGNTITKAQYDAIMAEYTASLNAPAAPQTQVSAPAPQSMTQQITTALQTATPGNPLMVPKQVPTALDPAAMVQGGSGASSQYSSSAIPSDAGSATTVTSSITSPSTQSGASAAPAPAKSSLSKYGALLLIPIAIGFMHKDG